MAPAGGKAQQIAGAGTVGRENRGISEWRECQNTIQVEKLWNVFQKCPLGKGGWHGGRSGTRNQGMGDEGLEPPTSRM